MAGETYSIQIRLNVDDSQLTAAEGRLNALQGGSGSTGGRYASGRSVRQAALYRNRRAGLTEGQRDLVAGLQRYQRSGAYGSLFNAAGASRGLAGVNRAWSRLTRDFTTNLFSINGFRRNIGNFTNVIGNVGGAMMKAIPVLGALGTSLAAFAAIKVGGMAVSGGLMAVGKKVLMGENMQKAAVDTMQFSTARNLLGPEYEQAYRRANEMSATYGYDRAGIMNTASMLSQLYMGGNKLGIDRGLDLAQIMGKISQYSGADYNRIGLNLQQILGQETTSTRDIRELITAAPVVSTTAQRMMMERTGSVGDTFEFLRDKTNVLDALYELDKQIQTHPIMKMRGAITLSKQNLWMEIADSGAAFFQDISDAVVNFNQMLQDKLSKYLNTYKPGTMTTMLDSFVNDVGALMDSLMQILPSIVKVVSFLGEHGNKIFFGAGGWLMDFNKGEKRRVNDEFEANTNNKVNFVMREIALRNGIPSEQLMKNEALSNTIRNDIVKNTKWGYRAYHDNFIDKARNALTDRPLYSPIDIKPEWNDMAKAGMGSLESPGVSNNTGTSDYSDLLSSMAGERKSLTINFNREIVSMPTNINATDVSNLETKLRPMMEDVVTSGLTRALTSATAMSSN